MIFFGDSSLTRIPIFTDSSHLYSRSSGTLSSKGNKSGGVVVDLEMAVLQQELMAGREESADLRAKVYLLEKEKGAQELAMGDR